MTPEIAKVRMDRLARMIENINQHTDAVDRIFRQAVGILDKLGISFPEARTIIATALTQDSISDLAGLESFLHHRCERPDSLAVAMLERAFMYGCKIKPHLLNCATLDLGGGSGELAVRVAEYCNRPVTVADVLDWRKVDVPFLQVQGNRVEAPDKAFAQVIVMTVFHHSDDPEALVREAFRLAAKRVIFIESVTENLLEYMYGSWIDWFYNHVIHHNADITKKINVPCRFLPAAAWEQMVFQLTGLVPKVSQNLGIFQFLNPENHHLFVYDVK